MSTLKVDTLKNGSSGAIDFPQNLKIGGNGVIQGYTASSSEPSSPATGDFWWDSANEKLYRYINGEFKELTLGSTAAWWGARGMRVGGVSLYYDGMEYFDLTVTSGNGTDFGDLLGNKQRNCAAGDAVRGITFGGLIASEVDNSEYWTFATTGNALNFGDLVYDSGYSGAVSNAVRGIIGGQQNNNYIHYVTIQTTGNSQDFGDLSEARYFCSSTNNLTHGIFIGGFNSSNAYTDRMDKITMDTAGNATDIGNFTDNNSGGGIGVCSDNTTGLVMGGNKTNSAWNNEIGKLTIATAGNASDFGDLSGVNAYLGQTSNADNARAMAIGGYAQNTRINTLEYVTISSPGNATDYGDLTGNTNLTGGVNNYCAGVSGNAS